MKREEEKSGEMREEAGKGWEERGGGERTRFG